MTRCYAEPDTWDQDSVLLSERETHHLARVRRVRVGKDVEVLDGRGRFARAEVCSAHQGKRWVLRLRETHCVPRPGLALTLAPCVLKKRCFDLVVQKAVELGFAAVQPVLSERCVVRHSPAELARLHQRWMDIAVDAAKQSGNYWLPEIGAPVELVTLLDVGRLRQDLFLAALLQAAPQSLRTVIRLAKERQPRRIALLVGPEGGFSAGETDAILAAGLCPVGLGSHVLRAETAALYGMCVLAYEFREATG